MISGGAHKIHGPKGIGYLGLNKTTKKIKINPLMYGGGQENGLSPGTLNVPLIVGLSRALEICEEHRAKETEYLNGLRLLFLRTLTEGIHGVSLNGPEERLLNNLSLRFENIRSNDLISGIKTLAFSAGSACATGEGKPSHVLKAIGLNDNQIKSTARFGFSRFNTEDEINTAANEIVNYLRLKRK
ncbi:MAG: aminotransferase class V-fold PLP-dependent enzyme [Ignavibacteriales bacterium]|nr:aminotransferase class V-fold PLP-dependent enzyme [Ignavibacteriales bacterium]